MGLDWITTLAALCAVSVVAYVAFIALFFFGARKAIRSQDVNPLPPPARERTGVTIMKPCAGYDDDLDACLESFCQLEYTNYQIVFGVRDANDAAYPVLRALKTRHPSIDIEIVFSTAGRSANPKVANLEVMVTRAKHPLLWISDSNTVVHPDTLASMVDDLEREPGVGAVVSPVAGVGEQSPGAALENLQLSAYVIMCNYAIYGVSRRVTFPGKSVLFRRASLDAIGGFEELGRYCAEDYILLEKLRARGERSVLGRRLVANVNATGAVKRCLERHTRWAQLRWLVTPATTLLEPLVSPMIPTLALLIAAPSVVTLGLFVGAAMMQLVGDMAMLYRLRGSIMSGRHFLFVWARPLLFMWIWARAAFTRKVIWRGNVRWIGPNSTILDEPPMKARLRAIRNSVVSR